MVVGFVDDLCEIVGGYGCEEDSRERGRGEMGDGRKEREVVEGGMVV